LQKFVLLLLLRKVTTIGVYGSNNLNFLHNESWHNTIEEQLLNNNRSIIISGFDMFA